ATEHRVVGDTGGDEDNIVADGQVGRGVDAFHQIAVSGGLQGFALRIVTRPHAGQDLAAQATNCGGGEDGLGRAAAAHVDVDVAVGNAGGDGGRDVAIANQADGGAGTADVFDQLLVPR